MGARTDLAAAVNARIGQIVEYGPDRRPGVGIFAALNGRVGRELNGTRAVVDPISGSSFHGYTNTPQRFVGIAPLGVARPVTPTTSTLGDEREANPLNDGALRIFAQRLARRRA